MTILSGSTVLSADVNAIVTTQLAGVRTVAAIAPIPWRVPLRFAGIVSSTPDFRRTVEFVVPNDCYVDSVALHAADMTAGATVQADITADGALRSWPITVAGVVAGTDYDAPRLLFDNSRVKTDANGRRFAVSGRAFRVLTKGATVTCVAQTSSVAAAGTLSVILALRQFYTR